MAIETLATRNRGVKYAGTLASANDMRDLLSETAQQEAGTNFRVTTWSAGSVTVTYDYFGEPRDFVVTANNWMVVSEGRIRWLDVSQTIVDAIYRTYDQVASLLATAPAFTTLISSMIASSAGAFGSLPNIVVPGLSNANFDVPIRPTMPNTTYTAVPVLTGSSSLLGSLSITNVTNGVLNNAGKISGSVCRINVANSGALQLSGAAILVHVTP